MGDYSSKCQGYFDIEKKFKDKVGYMLDNVLIEA